LTKKEFEDITTLLYVYKQTEGLDWKAFIANICGENGWDKDTPSSVGAQGLCQIMDETFKHMNFCLGKFGEYNIKNVYYVIL
jgi:membrane-bound lytic murein transglycosylase MltF